MAGRAIVPVLLLLALVGRGIAMTAETPEKPEDGWTTWSPRAEIAPHFSRDAKAGKAGKPALRITSESRAFYGAWRRRFGGVQPGKSYRFTAFCRTTGVPDPSLCASARLEWRRADGQGVRPPDYLPALTPEDGWTKLEQTFLAPEGAASAQVELAFGWAPAGTAWWDRIEFTEAPMPKARQVRVATVYHRPRNSTPAANLEQFCRLAEGIADRKPDVVLFPEGILLPGTNKRYSDVAEAVPGPTTDRLGILARKLKAYVVAGVMERVGPVIYNSAVLIDREGRLAGTYRKTHLPREEVEGGVTPGDTYPVFATDFGKVGLAICWDTQFPEPIRAMALQGADLILVPIWGGSDIVVRTRAIENHVYLATSSYDMATFIVDPTGAVLAQAGTSEPVAVAEVDLDKKLVQPWLGDMKVRTWRERRSDLPLPQTHGPAPVRTRK